MRHLFSGLLAFILVSFASCALQAATYGAGIETSQWYLSESVFECSLVHEVPGYGRAVFKHRAGESLAFYLESEMPLMQAGTGSLAVEAPAWRPGIAPRPLGEVKVVSDTRQVTLGSNQSMQIVQGLLEGMRPTVSQRSWFDRSIVRVQVSNINFPPYYAQYRSCASGLLPVNFDQIKRSRILFRTGGARLSAGDRRLLDNIVTYVQADSTVERLFVDGHTDSSGSRIDNRVLSEERANAVADYLIEQGIPSDMITVRAHADRYPASRTNPRENRRTTIRLQRQGERPDFQQAQGYVPATPSS